MIIFKDTRYNIVFVANIQLTQLFNFLRIDVIPSDLIIKCFVSHIIYHLLLCQTTCNYRILKLKNKKFGHNIKMKGRWCQLAIAGHENSQMSTYVKT